MNRKALVLIVGSIITIVGAFPVYADVIDSITTNNANPTHFGEGGGSSFQYIGWSYLPGASHNICTATVTLDAVGTPSDAVKFDLYIGTSTTSFVSSGMSFLRHSDTDIQVRGSTFTTYTFTFTPCAIVVGANWYAWVMYRDGAADSSNYYRTSANNSTFAQTGTASWIMDAQFYAGIKNLLTTTGWDITLNGTENLGATAPSSTPSFANSVFNNLSGITDQNASSTIANSASGFTNIPSYFANRVPWGYIFAIRDIYNAASTSTTDFGALTFTFASSSFSNATATFMFLPQKITVFSTSTVTYYLNGNGLAAANTLLAAAGWISMIMYWFRRATTV